LRSLIEPIVLTPSPEPRAMGARNQANGLPRPAKPAKRTTLASPSCACQNG
jgi:hypothetical protein